MGKINQAEDVVIKKNKATQVLVRQASSRLNLDCNSGNPEPRGNCKCLDLNYRQTKAFICCFDMKITLLTLFEKC